MSLNMLQMAMRRDSVWHRCNFVSVDFSHSDGSYVLFQVLMLNRHLVHVHDSPTSVLYSQQQFSHFCGCLQCHFNLLYRPRHQRCAKPSNSCLTILHKLVTCSFHLLLFTRPQFTIGYTSHSSSPSCQGIHLSVTRCLRVHLAMQTMLYTS